MSIKQMSLKALDFKPANYTPSVYEGFKIDYSPLERNLAKIEARHYKAAETLGTIDAAFANYDKLLHQDDETRQWFEGFKQKYKDNVARMAANGDYESAIYYGTQVAAQAAQDPELIARMKTNAQYEQNKKVVDTLYNTGKINKDIYDQWMEENPYSFNPITNKETGQTIGGKDWSANWMAIEPINMTDFYARVKSLAGVDSGSSQSVRFVDENGNTVSNPSSGMYAMEIKSGSSWRRVSAKKMREIFDAALDEYPGARETFEQDYNNRLWKFNKATQNEKNSFYGGDLLDDQGNKRTLEEFIKRKAYPVINRMEDNDVKSSIDYSPNQAYVTARLNAARDAATNQALLEQSKSITAGIEVPMSTTFATTYQNLQGALKTIDRLYKDTDLYKKNASIINGFKNRGDYLGLYNFLNARQRFITNKDDKVALAGALRTIKSDGETYNSLSQGMDKDDIDAIITYAAVTTGTPFTNAPNNKSAQQIAKNKNKLFSATQVGKVIPNNKFYIAFNDEEYFNKFLEGIKQTKNTLKIHGLTYRNEDGKVIVDVYKNCDILQEIANQVQIANNEDSTRDWHWHGIRRIGNWGDKKIAVGGYYKDNYIDIGNGTRVRRSNNPNRPLNDSYHGNVRYENALLFFSKNGEAMQSLSNRVDNAFKKAGKSIVITGETGMYGSFQTYALEGLLKEGKIKFSDLKTQDDFITGEERDLMKGDLTHIADFDVWMLNKSTGNLEKVSLANMKDLQEYMNSAIADDKWVSKTVTSGTDVGVGYTITVPAGTDKEGKPQGIREARQFYIEGINQNKAMEAVARNPELLYNKAFHRARALDTKSIDIMGNNINYNDGNDEFNRNRFIAAKKLEEYYDKNIAAASTLSKETAPNINREILRREYDNTITQFMIESGINPNTPQAKARKEKIKKELEIQFFQTVNAE